MPASRYLSLTLAGLQPEAFKCRKRVKSTAQRIAHRVKRATYSRPLSRLVPPPSLPPLPYVGILSVAGARTIAWPCKLSAVRPADDDRPPGAASQTRRVWAMSRGSPLERWDPLCRSAGPRSRWWPMSFSAPVKNPMWADQSVRCGWPSRSSLPTGVQGGSTLRLALRRERANFLGQLEYLTGEIQ
jgi:hypothetical protein